MCSSFRLQPCPVHPSWSLSTMLSYSVFFRVVLGPVPHTGVTQQHDAAWLTWSHRRAGELAHLVCENEIWRKALFLHLLTTISSREEWEATAQTRVKATVTRDNDNHKDDNSPTRSG